MGAALLASLATLWGAGKPTGKKWLDMDYGPFLSFSIEAPAPGTNIVFKGLAVPLGQAPADGGPTAMVFDTDLLRWAAGWQGGFLSLNSVVFDGAHWAYPKIDGDQLFGNPALPGASANGKLTDPRESIYGPLPRTWAHWKGLYRHGRRLVFCYSVGEARIWESPDWETRGSLGAFSRTLNIGPSAHDLLLQVAFEPGRVGQLIPVEKNAPGAPSPPAGPIMAWLPPVIPAGRPAPQPAAVEPGALAGDWDLTPTPEGRVKDRSPAARDLRLDNAFSAFGRQKGPALEFRGHGRAETEQAADLEFLETDLTIAARIFPRADGGLAALTAPGPRWTPDGKGLFLRDGRLCFDIGWAGVVETPKPLPPDQWSHVAVTWTRKNGKISLFVNGRWQAAKTLRPKKAVPGQVLRLGFVAPNFPAKPFFNGLMEEVRLYRRALTEAEIRALAGPADGGENRAVAAGLAGAPAAVQWQADAGGHLRLLVPAQATPARFKVLVAGISPTNLADFARLVKSSPAAEDLEPLTRGGPALWPETLKTRITPLPGKGPFEIQQLTAPENNPWNSWMRFAGFDFFRDPDRAAICTWSGDVWLVSGLEKGGGELAWRRFAAGLYEPGGLKIVDDRVYVLARDQITRLHDLNGDGEADWHENFNNDVMNSEHFHEFVYDLQTDANGDFYYLKGSCHALDAKHPHHGAFLKVSRDGSRTEVLARGFRAPNGLGLGPGGEFFTTDQEGYWMPQNRLNLIQPGRFYGNPWSWFPEGKPLTNDPPMVWVHRSVDRSPSTMIWVTPDSWGPLKNHWLSLSYGVGKIFLVMMEKVGGREQGGITELPLEFDTGIMRARFGPKDDRLYLAGLFGWAGDKTKDGGFFRVRYRGEPLRVPGDLRIARDGVVLGFTDPLDPASATDTANYHVQVWNYKWTSNYGSPDFKLNGERGRDTLPVKQAFLSADRRTLFLEIPEIGPVMQMHVRMNIKAADGAPIRTYVHNTIHRLNDRPGLDWLGENPIRVEASSDMALRRETFGLRQRFTTRADGGAAGASDVRPARLAALWVPEGEPPTPFLPAGPFDCEWQGFIKLDVSADYQFAVTGRGKVTLAVNGFDLLREAEAAPDGATTGTVRLRGGLNRLEIRYRSPPGGAAEFRLWWSSQGVPREPVPPTSLVHEGVDDAGQVSLAWRQGRRDLAAYHCLKCHQPAAPLPPAAMPELEADAPALDRAGEQWNPGWLAAWLKNPAASVAEAVMPAVLSAQAAEAEAQARDLTAFLGTLRGPGAPPDDGRAPPDDPALLKTGAELFGQLGCVACHRLPGDAPVGNDSRRSLAHVRAKWRPAALVEFLQQPEKRWRWTRMPNFQLTPAEAAALAAHVLARGDGPVPPPPAGGDAARGAALAASLGCANCHSVPGAAKRGDYPALEKISGSNPPGGCLAAEPGLAGSAPRFPLAADARRNLATFLQGAVAAGLPALRQDTWEEFAARQMENLRCFACHEREDGRDFWFALEAGAPKAAAAPADEEEDALSGQTIHNQRPPLVWTGEKLRPVWVEQFLGGNLAYKPRRKMAARMPAFPAYARGLSIGLARQHGLSEAEPPPGPPDPRLAAAGRELAQKGALSCVDCHDTGKNLALAGGDTATINFAHIPERLRRAYYDRYLQDPQRLLPGTMMPKFGNEDGRTGVTSHFGGDARRQFEALWHYMLLLGAAGP